MGADINIAVVTGGGHGIGLVGYAYIGDLTPSQVRVTEPITLDVD